ncbi:3-oxo-5-alpha-steroid 4-dehydrogenase-domain-containing protein, partial [Clohesyomyces aquaticus]
PVVVLRSLYVAASALILFIQQVSPLRSRFLAYGSRATHQAPDEPRQPSEKRPAPSWSLAPLLDYLAGLRVPHSYFAHFYLTSVACSIFWGYWLWPTLTSESGEKVRAVWLLMLLQGSRRLWESYRYSTKSKSQMWIGHYFLGLLFYLAVNVAIWIEIADEQPDAWYTYKLVAFIIPCYYAHGIQHVCHSYLFRLRTENEGPTYKLPSDHIFSSLICPHYTMEVLIYVCMSLLGAPTGRYINWTLAAAALFVAVNLGVTASGTKAWYVEQFGEEKIRGRRVMIPGIW